MKKIKYSHFVRRLVGIVAAVLMAFGVVGGTAIPAFAATSHSITIKNTNTNISINGKTYTAYKLFDSTQNADKSAVAYTLSTSSPFYSEDLTTELTGTTPASLSKVLRTYFTFTALSGDSTKLNVTAKETFSANNARAFADAIQPYLSSVDLKIGTGTTTYKKTATASYETATINLDSDDAGLGYYIVTGSASPKNPKETETVESAVMVTNEDPSPEVNPKADVPSLSKKITDVKEGNETVTDAKLDDDGKAAVAKVGSTVSFELDSKVPDLTGYTDYTYKITDTLTKGLDYVATADNASNVVVKIGGTALAIGKYSVTINDKSLTVNIPYATLNEHQSDEDKTIAVTYDAKVNTSSLTHNFEKNTASLEYSNSPYATGEGYTNTTPNQDTYVLNINVNVTKVDSGNANTNLPNAEFKLYKQEGTTKSYYKYDTTNNAVTWVSTETAGDTFTTGNDGELAQPIRGLDKGTYFLDETKAPAGYNKPASATTINIIASEADGTVTYKVNGDDVTNGTVKIDGTVAQNENHPVANVQIKNSKGSLLPSTGGIGTTLFYIAGGILIIGAAVLLIGRRKRNA